MTGIPKSTLETESKGDKPPHRVLALFDRKTGKSKLLQDKLPDSMLWARDGRHLVVVNVSSNAIADGTHHYDADISLIDSISLQNKNVTILHATDISGASRGKLTPTFQPMKITKDGKFLLMRVSNYTGYDNPFFKETAFLDAIDLTNGKVYKVATINDPGGRVIGWDWHDLSTPAQ